MLSRLGRLPTSIFAGLTGLYVLGSSVGSVVGSTQAAFSVQTANPSNTVASLYVQAPSQSTPESAAGGVVRLSWSASATAATRAVEYRVFRRSVGGSFTQLTATPITALTYQDTPPADGTCEYAIQAVVSTFASPNSNLPIATSDRTPPVVTAAAQAGGSAYRSGGWTNQTVTVSFTCSDATSGVASCPSSASVAGEGANQSVTGTATDHAGNSRTVTFGGISIDKTAPTAASNLTGSTGASTGTIALSWTAASDILSGIAGYDVFVAQGATGRCRTYSQSGSFGPTTSDTVTGLTSGAQYCIYLVSRDTASNSGPASASVTARAG